MTIQVYQLFSSLPVAAKVALLFGYFAFEAWLGKTSKVESGSLAELVLVAPIRKLFSLGGKNMKEIAKFDQAIGGDGARAKGALVVEDGSVKAQVEVSYPLDKVVDPALAVFNNALDKLKAAIPGSWDDVIVEEVKVAAKAELIALLGQV